MQIDLRQQKINHLKKKEPRYNKNHAFCSNKKVINHIVFY
jgi:hypothetical protein